MFVKLRAFARRPARNGAVLLSYAGIILALAFGVNSGANTQRDIQHEAKRADAAIVANGQKAIRNGCDFDNKRARELRGILHRSVRNVTQLEKEGAITHEVAVRSLRETRRSIKRISYRNCDAEAKTLSSNPKQAR